MSWSQLLRSQSRAEASPNLLSGFYISRRECRRLPHILQWVYSRSSLGLRRQHCSNALKKGNLWTASSKEIHTERETPVCKSLPHIWTSWEVPLSPKKHRIILLFHTLRFCFWSLFTKHVINIFSLRAAIFFSREFPGPSWEVNESHSVTDHSPASQTSWDFSQYPAHQLSAVFLGTEVSLTVLPLLGFFPM